MSEASHEFAYIGLVDMPRSLLVDTPRSLLRPSAATSFVVPALS